MSVYSGFSTRSQESYYDTLCMSLIVSLSQRVLKALRHEAVDDEKFSKTITNIHKKLIEIELHKYLPPKASECLQDLVGFCHKNFNTRPHSIGREVPKRFSPDKTFGSKTPNLSFLDKIIEEAPKLQRSHKKYSKNKAGNPRVETSNHPYYESMMSKYLKISLKSPLRNSATTSRNKQTSNQVQLTDGMFFRLF